MDVKAIILKNFGEFYELAELATKTKKYNAAVTLYYKALIELCDLFLLKSINKIGANHSDRFLLLKMSNPDMYATSSRLFTFYRDSYNKEMSQATAEVFKNEVDKAKRMAFGAEENKKLD